jgi:hypothetical protein
MTQPTCGISSHSHCSQYGYQFHDTPANTVAHRALAASFPLRQYGLQLPILSCPLVDQRENPARDRTQGR